MPIVDELKSKLMIHPEKCAEIRAKDTNQKKMRTLFEALEAGGETVKIHFFYALKNHELFLFKDLGGTTENNCELDNREPNTPESMELR